MADRPPSLPRRLAVAAALLVPLVVDPFGADTQGLKGTVLAMCGLAALLCGAVETLSGGRERRAPFLPETLLLLLAGWAALSLTWAVNRELGLGRVLMLVGMLGVARSVRDTARDSAEWRRWLAALLLVGAAAVAIDTVAILRALEQLPDPASKYASLVFVHNNMAASYVAMLAPLAMPLVLGAATPARAVGWLALLGGLLLYLGLLGSRAGVLGALLGVSVVGGLFLLRSRLAGWRPDAWRWGLLGGVVLALATLVPISETARGWIKAGFYRVVSAQVLRLDDASFRPFLWSKTIEMVRDQPLTGVGAGNFVVTFPRYERQQEPKPHAHNDTLQVLAELGLPGLFLFLALLGASLFSLLRAIARDRGRAGPALATGLFGSVVVLVLSGQFEVPFALGATASITAVAIGLAGALEARNAATAQVAAAGAGADGASGRGEAARGPAALTLVLALPLLLLLAARLPASFWLRQADDAAAHGDLGRALEAYGRVAALRTGSYYPESRMASICLARGDAAGALPHIQAARRRWPWGSELMELEGDVLARLDRPGEAAAAYAAAVEASPASSTAFLKRVQAMARAGEFQSAIDLLQYRARSMRDVSEDVILYLAELWRRRAEQLRDDERVFALAAARHFYAVLLEEGDPRKFWDANAAFRDLTHRLQISPGGLQAWFAVYRRFLEQNSLNMPNSALWTSMDPDGKRLFPGWLEPVGPPVPGAWRSR